MRLVRRVINNKYRMAIKKMYGDPVSDTMKYRKTMQSKGEKRVEKAPCMI